MPTGCFAFYPVVEDKSTGKIREIDGFISKNPQSEFPQQF